MKKLFVILLFLGVLFSCEKAEENKNIVSSVSIDSELSLKMYESGMLEAKVFPDDGLYHIAKWTSSDPYVASVDDLGQVVAFKAGTTEITATIDGVVSNKCIVTVMPCDANVDIPDAKFKIFLLNKAYFQEPNTGALLSIDIDCDGEISETEALLLTTEIDCRNMGIYSLKGIEAFKNIPRLVFESNKLAVVDLSQNTKLKDLGCNNAGLVSLDLSKNTTLKDVSCFSNMLTALDVSKNKDLESVEVSNNLLRTLDFSENTRLHTLSCGHNQLTFLNVPNSPKLTSLDCRDNHISVIDVSKSVELQYLTCSYNNLATLDVSKNIALKSLDCSHNRLTSLDVSENTMLEQLTCDFNPNLKTIFIKKGQKVKIHKDNIVDIVEK